MRQKVGEGGGESSAPTVGFRVVRLVRAWMARGDWRRRANTGAGWEGVSGM